MIKKIFLPFLVFIFLFTAKSCSGQGKGKKTYTTDDGKFKITYPISITPVILKNDDDITAAAGRLVIKKMASKYETKTAGSDCYQFVKTYTTAAKVALKEYVCTKETAGTTYYSFMYFLEQGDYRILLKFTCSHCNICKDKNGKVKPFDEIKDTRWITEMLETIKSS